MPDLMAPCQRQELISALACRMHERQADVVDAERVLLERPGRLLVAVDLATQLAPARDRLDRVGAALGQVPEAEAATATNHRDESGPLEPKQYVARPAVRRMRGVQEVNLVGGEKPMVVQALQDIDMGSAKSRWRATVALVMPSPGERHGERREPGAEQEGERH